MKEHKGISKRVLVTSLFALLALALTAPMTAVSDSSESYKPQITSLKTYPYIMTRNGVRLDDVIIKSVSHDAAYCGHAGGIWNVPLELLPDEVLQDLAPYINQVKKEKDKLVKQQQAEERRKQQAELERQRRLKAERQNKEKSWFKTGWELHEEKKYAESVYYFQKAAEAGHAKAQYMMGCAYLFSKGVAYDYYEAIRWLSASMLQGHEPATMQIGFDALEKKDYSKAYAYFLHVKLTSKDAEWKKIADTALKAKHFTKEHRKEGRKGQKMIEENIREIRKIQMGLD